MNVLFSAFLFLGLTAASHMIYRRINPSKKVDAIPIFGISLFWFGGLLFFLPVSHPLFSTMSLFYFLAVGSYIILHTTTIHQSPSHAILLSLKIRGEADEQALAEDWPDARLVDPRLSDLVKSGCVTCEYITRGQAPELHPEKSIPIFGPNGPSFSRGNAGLYTATPLGKKALGFIRSYQKWLGRKVGG